MPLHSRVAETVCVYRYSSNSVVCQVTVGIMRVSDLFSRLLRNLPCAHPNANHFEGPRAPFVKTVIGCGWRGPKKGNPLQNAHPGHSIEAP